MVRSLDDKIKETLLEATKEAPELKDKVFENIQASIQEERGEDRMTRNGRPSILKLVAVASIFIIILFTTTEYGQATIDKIRTFFQPEKPITEHIEGTEEEKEYNLEDSKMGYIIYIDRSMYEKVAEEGRDRIVPLYKADYLPEMYMEITQEEDLSPEEVAAKIEGEQKGEFAEFENQGLVNDPIKAILLKGKTGIQYDDIIVKYYLVDNTKGGTFVIKTQYTLEAAEGHGARFYHMLKEFKVVDLEELEG